MASYHRGGVRRGWRGGGGFQQSGDGGGGNRGGRGGRGADGGGGNRGGRGGRGGDWGDGNRDGRGGRGGNRGGHGGRGGYLQRSGDEAGGSESERHVVRQGGPAGGGAYQHPAPAGRGGGRGGRGSGGNNDNVYNRGGGGGAYQQHPAGRGGVRGGRGSGGNNDNVYNRGGGGGQRQDGGREGVVDYFGDGRSSQRADLRQAELPLSLEERCSEEAAARRKEFREMYAPGAKPTFPPRPGYGAAGTPCTVRANHFYVRLADKVLHHYDVTISPEPRHKDVCREVLSKLVSERQQTDLDGRLPAYDGRRSLYTAAKLPFDSKQFEVTLTDNNSKRKERNYTVVVKHATEISLHQLWTLLAGCSTDIPGQALQVLDVVLRDIVLNECNDMEYIAVGQSFFSEHIGGVQDKSLGLGIAYWKGFYQSVRPTQNGLSLIADISSTAFIKPLLLTEFAKEVLNDIDGKIISRGLTDDEHAKVQKALKGVRIEVTHRGDERRKYRVTGLSLEPASELSFVLSSGEMTVMEYFRDKYNLELKHGFLPCVQIGSEQNRSYLPMEVCKIVPRQRYLKNLNEVQASNLMKSTCQHPSAREESIRQHKLANEFGIEVDNNPTEIEARVLLPPTLKYCDSGHGNTCRPRNGKWNMANKKVVNGASVRNWLCVNFCHDLSQHVVDGFCSELAERSRATGVRFPNLELPPIFTSHPNQVEADIRKFCEEAQMRLKCQKIDLLLAILPYSNRSLYGNIKRICETEIGIKSQCCLKNSILKMNINFVPNVIIKINAKAGGRNSVFLNTEASLPIVSNKPTIIFGADVTHPDALDDSAPSIAAVVASQDWPEVVKYNGVVRAQGHREEIISGLEDIVKELLFAFGEENTKKPQQLIFYRDGVGEGQFKQVLEKEIPEIEKAWKALYNNEKPHITFIVVQKRHHTRLFPRNYNDRCYIDNQGNVNPGTVVDQKICHPTEFDFFMCSHAAGPKTRGTSRPVHYHVLRDDNKFTADQLQSLTNNLCYTYPCCTRSISVAPPVHYAHKLAARARCYLTQGHDGGAAAPAGGPNPLPAIKDEVKRSMFYL